VSMIRELQGKMFAEMQKHGISAEGLLVLWLRQMANNAFFLYQENVTAERRHRCAVAARKLLQREINNLIRDCLTTEEVEDGLRIMGLTPLPENMQLDRQHKVLADVLQLLIDNFEIQPGEVALRDHND
jgi:hypothetical protein